MQANPGTSPRTGQILIGASAHTVTQSGTAAATLGKIAPAGVEGWPNGRTFDNLPPNAVDGSLTTFTWTTNPFNTAAPAYLGLNFGAAKPVSRLRLYKSNDGGGGATSDNFKNLVIEYTATPASVPLAQRVWTRVGNLRNGYQGGELLNAVAVNLDGTVTRDGHESPVSGWASLTFDAVNATGIRVGFSNVTNPLFYNHYKVFEFEAWGAQ